MSHLLYLMFQCDFDVMESLDFVGGFGNLNTPLVMTCRVDGGHHVLLTIIEVCP